MPITAYPAVAALPPAPDPNDRATFNARAYPWTAALANWTDQVNAAGVATEDNAAHAGEQAMQAGAQRQAADAAAALAQDWAVKLGAEVAGGGYSARYHADAAAASAASAIASPGTSATSASVLTIAPGDQSLVVQPGKALVLGQFVTIAYNADPGNYMAGQIVAYDSVTGALAVRVSATGGAGTYADWSVGHSFPVAAEVTRILWRGIAAAYTALPGEGLACDTSGGPLVVTLPAAPQRNDVVRFADLAGTFGVHPLTVARAGSPIMGLPEDMTVDRAYTTFSLTYIDAVNGWTLT